MNSKDESDRNPCNDHQSGHVDNGCPDSGKPASPNAPVATEATASPPKAAYRKTDIRHWETKAFEISSGTRFQLGRQIICR